MKKRKIINKLMASVVGIMTWLIILESRVQADLITKGNNFVKNNGALKMTEVWSKLQPVAQIMMAVAIAVYVGVGMVIGVKFMFKGPDEKAKMKERLIWYVIAGVLIFGVVGIFNIVITTLTAVTS